MLILIETILKSNINQYKFNGGVAQLVRARDSYARGRPFDPASRYHSRTSTYSWDTQGTLRKEKDMATIIKRNGKWQVKIRRTNFKQLSKNDGNFIGEMIKPIFDP